MFVLLLNASIYLQVSACCCAVLYSCLSKGLHINAYMRLSPWLPILCVDVERKGVSRLYLSFSIS